ncbi:MAG: EamA family transporter [Prevotellaceae bacterium]|jgi:undecaprenyl phosphate-alpha-L-ara4N flippase subunit ArnE|nr:EamA family transporter [Prevotellaceae bacterium]
MLKIILLSVAQCLLLSGGQVMLKLAMGHTGQFGFTWVFFRSLLVNYRLLASGLCMTAATILWLYIIKHFDFSVAYPITGMSYVFGMLAATCIFHEAIPLTRWIGVALIVGGVALTTR